jgi:hypothetical protein
VLAIGILAQFCKCDSHLVFKRRLQPERECYPTTPSKQVLFGNSILLSPALYTYGIVISDGRPHKGCSQGCYSCSPVFDQTSVASCLRRRSSDCFAELLDHDQDHIHQDSLTDRACTPRPLRSNRSDFRCRSERPRNQFLRVLETASTTYYSVGLLTIMRYNTSYRGSSLAKLSRCSKIRGAIYLLHTALELAAGATNYRLGPSVRSLTDQ